MGFGGVGGGRRLVLEEGLCGVRVRVGGGGEGLRGLGVTRIRLGLGVTRIFVVCYPPPRPPD